MVAINYIESLIVFNNYLVINVIFLLLSYNIETGGCNEQNRHFFQMGFDNTFFHSAAGNNNAEYGNL